MNYLISVKMKWIFFIFSQKVEISLKIVLLGYFIPFTQPCIVASCVCLLTEHESNHYVYFVFYSY